jgi:hypothetical protein
MKRQADTASTPVSFLVTLCLMALSPLVHAQAAAAIVPQPISVALTPGTCNRVADGDIVTLYWNPVFTHAEAVDGLRNFVMSFARAGDRPRALLTGQGVVLRSIPRRGHPGVDTPTRALANGYFQLRFRADLGATQPGEYHLLSAEAIPRVAPGYQGEAPGMTNSPASLPFCVDVTSLPRRGYVP